MPGDATNRGAANRICINIHESHEIACWIRAAGVSAEELRKAVEAVGPMADDVRRQPGQAAPLSACGFRFHSSWLSVSRTAGRAAVRPRRPAPAARGGSAPSRPGR